MNARPEGKPLLHDRADAGRRLGESMRGHVEPGSLVLALPRGGVVVAREVARVLDADLDVLLVRKVCMPGEPDEPVGALAPGYERVDWARAQAMGYTRAEAEAVVERERLALEGGQKSLRGDRHNPWLKGRRVVLVDDGVADGAAAAVAAARAAHALGARRVAFAAPVASDEGFTALAGEVDDTFFLDVPPRLATVSRAYEEFPPVADEEIRRILREEAPPPPAGETRAIRVGSGVLEGDLAVPESAWGVVVLAQGIAGGRRGPRNRRLAERLRASGLATLVVDLVTQEEAADDELRSSARFDVGALGRRVERAVDWVVAQPETRGLPVALLGEGTGAPAVLRAAARMPEEVRAVVCRGGRVDLASGALPYVRAPTLLVVGGRDDPILTLNGAALEGLRGPKMLVVVQDVSGHFGEPGAIEEAGRVASAWLRQHLPRPELKAGPKAPTEPPKGTPLVAGAGAI